MKILAIETSCDETAVAILDCKGDKSRPSFKLLAESLHSQVKLHEKYGGVFPMMAKRAHAENLVPLTISALRKSKMLKKGVRSEVLGLRRLKAGSLKLEAILCREIGLFDQLQKHILNLKRPQIDLIAVTEGPGLEPALWVGINFARALGLLWNIPVVGINHMEGHIASVLLRKTNKVKSLFPAIALLISGGHTELVKITKWGQYKILGKTRDDAVGEAFDKVARLLGLPYPGGPAISSLAQKARSLKLEAGSYALPRPMIHSKELDFSFSGLKTAVLYLTHRLGKLNDDDKKNIALEFENSITEVLVSKTTKALQETGAKTLIVAGGVSANTYIRKNLKMLEKSVENLKVIFPDRKLSTDNAVMIGIAGFLKVVSGKWNVEGKKTIQAKGNLSLEK